MAKALSLEERREKLSDRQLKILDYIENHIETKGYPPTIREIGAAVNIGSTSVVNYNLNKLVREGFLERSEKVSRGLLLVQSGHMKAKTERIKALASANIVSIPLAGQIVASRPVEFFGLHQDDDDVQIEIPASLLGKVAPEQVFALRVSGNSMIDAMVSDGDTVILRQQRTADNGDMVAVWLSEDNETTLKYFYQENPSTIRLQPANPEMDAIFVDARQVEVQGRVLAVMRSL